MADFRNSSFGPKPTPEPMNVRILDEREGSVLKGSGSEGLLPMDPE